MKVKPLHKRVLVRILSKEEEKTSGGIIITAVNKERPIRAIVTHTVEGSDLKEGDEVLIPKGNSGMEIEVEGKLLFALPYKEIYAVKAWST